MQYHFYGGECEHSVGGVMCNIKAKSILFLRVTL